MTANDSTASSTTKKTTAEQETNIYKTLFMVTAPITALLAGGMGVGFLANLWCCLLGGQIM